MKTLRFLLFFLFLLGGIVQAKQFPVGFWGKPSTGGGGAAPQPTLVWWKFTEDTGTTVADTSTLGTSTLNLYSAALWTTYSPGYGIVGGSATLWGLTANPVTFGSNVISVSFRANKANWSAATAMFFETSPSYSSTPGSWAIFTDTDGFIHVGMSGSTSGTYYSHFAAPSNGTDHNVIVVFNMAAPSITAYVDGSGVTVTNDGNTLVGSTVFAAQQINVLARGAGASLYNNAKIKDVRIWPTDQATYAATIYANPQ